MRIDWDQELEGCSLLRIRNILRSVSRGGRSFTTEAVARKLQGSSRIKPSRAAMEHAGDLMEGLLASNLIEQVDGLRDDLFALSSAGASLCAHDATKRFKRGRAEAAIAQMLAVVSDINADHIFLYDIAWVAVFGSFITDVPDLGDIDLAVELKGRWEHRRVGEPSNREEMLAKFIEAHEPPAHIAESFIERLCWPETRIKRLLRVDNAMKILDRSQLEELGCPHRVIYPETRDVPAKSGWACERQEIRLVPGTAEQP